MNREKESMMQASADTLLDPGWPSYLVHLEDAMVQCWMGNSIRSMTAMDASQQSIQLRGLSEQPSIAPQDIEFVGTTTLIVAVASTTHAMIRCC